MTAEQQYLSELVRVWAAGGAGPVPLPPGVALAPVIELLRMHKVEAVLGPLLPPGASAEDLVAQMEGARSRPTFLLLELERLCPALKAAGVEPVLLKGAALALGTYANPSDRWFLDLDLLVPRTAVGAVCDRLAAAGYQPLAGRRDPLFYEKYHLHRILLGPQGSVVEVHWALTLPGSVYRHDVDGVRSRAETLGLGRRQVLGAAPLDLILHGVYQNIADGFVDLRRVLDLVLLLRRLGPEDWVELASLARAGGTGRALYATLHMVKQIAELDLPDGFMASIAPDAATRRTLAGLHLGAACLDRKAETSPGFAQMLHLLLTPTFGQQVREALRSLWVGEALLLDLGYDPRALPGFMTRSKIGLGQAKSLLMAKSRLIQAFVAA